MMPEDCSEISAETAKAGDRYYKVIGEWIRGRMQSESLRRQARRLATAYRHSLDLVINCYRRIRGSSTAKKELHFAREIQSLLEKDIEILGPSTGDLRPQHQPEQ